MPKNGDLSKLWRVLVVEDEALIAEELQDRLVRMGCQVAGVADTGAAAIELARETRPDLVLMDIRLKGPMDGIEAAQQIFRRFDTPIVFLTAHSDQDTFQRTQMDGTFGYLLKPFHARDLSVAMAMAVSRFRMDQRVRESEHTHAAIVNSIVDAALVADAHGRIRIMNRSAESLTGWESAEAVGRHVEHVLQVADKSGVQMENPAVQALRDNSVCPLMGQLLLLNRQGNAIPVEGHAAPILDWTGKPNGAIVILRDVTERLSLEEELHEAQKMQALGQLAGGVAHDFNNFLTVINGYGNMLVEGLDGQPELQQKADQIRKAGSAAAAITDQLLAFSQQRAMQPEIVDLNKTVHDCRDILKQLLGDGSALELDLASDLHPVMATLTGIQQVLVNLTVNARDAMPGRGRLVIRTANASRPGHGGRYVRITVEDSGAGIPPEVLPKIFEPFFTTKPVGEGTGLGLATVYGIVKQREGWVDVESAPGRGATFHVYLPAA